MTHHGVGLSKARAMVDEQGDGGRRLFAAAKAALDPEGRMNPGKLIGSGFEFDQPELEAALRVALGRP